MMLQETRAGAPVRQTLQLADGAVSYLEWKIGEVLPPLHFAHANGFNALTYRQLLTPLAARFHIRASDARGHGMTALPADPAHHPGWSVYGADLIRCLEAFAEEAGEPVILGGHSLGAAASLMVTALRPDLVRGLLLVEPVMPQPLASLIISLGRHLHLTIGPERLARGAERRQAVWPDRATITRTYKGRGAFRTWPDAMIADYVEGGTRGRSDGQVELACAPAWEAATFRRTATFWQTGGDIWSYAGRLSRPVTLIYGGRESTCSDAVATRLIKRDPHANILRIGTSTHFLPMEEPELVRREAIALYQRAVAGYAS